MIEKRAERKKNLATLKTAVIAAIIAFGISTVSSMSMMTITDPLERLVEMGAAALLCLSIACTVGFGLSWLGRRHFYRRLASAVRFLLNLVLLNLVASAALGAVLLIFGGSGVFTDGRTLLMQLAVFFGITTFVSAAVTFAETLNALTGSQTLAAGLAGTYLSPKTEDLIVAFIDLRGSTSMADKSDAHLFFAALNEFLRIVELCAYVADGQIHKYVGDCAIITWPSNPANAVKAATMLADIRTELAERRTAHIDRFGNPLECSAGIHCGTVTVAEVGDTRVEIGYWGDVMNTTARLQSACSALSCEMTASSEFKLLAEAGGETFAGWEACPGVELKGKEKPADLWGFPRTDRTQTDD